MNNQLPARLLRLLSLLQSRREWPGGELAERLGVSGRTIRRDIDRLRELGYPVHGTTGIAGGYRLASGRNLPPLLLDDDEAVAIAVALRTAASARVIGIEETAVRALVKLEQVLPPRLRRQVAAVGESTVGVPYQGGPPADTAVLATLAAACRDHELIVFDYQGRSGARTSRRVEPYSMVAAYGRWYLVGYDLRRDGWRTFRLDRLSSPTPVRRRFTPRPLPEENAAAFVRRAIAQTPYRYTARVTVPVPADVVRARLPILLPAKVEPLGADSCRVTLGADHVESIVRDLVALDVEASVEAPAEVLEHLRSVACRLLAMADQAEPPTGTSAEPPLARRQVPGAAREPVGDHGERPAHGGDPLPGQAGRGTG